MQTESDDDFDLVSYSPPNPVKVQTAKQWRQYMKSVSVSESSKKGNEESGCSSSGVRKASWISSFCNLRGNDFFCAVDRNYIEDNFNLDGLKSQVSNYGDALDLILDFKSPHVATLSEDQKAAIRSSAEKLYGLIHARYIATNEGLAAMLEKYNTAEFGLCPRVYCRGQSCLPVGKSDIILKSPVKIYCPKCEDIYFPPNMSRTIDGAYFGRSFPHLFLVTYQHLRPKKRPRPYVPRLFGFKVHKPAMVTDATNRSSSSTGTASSGDLNMNEDTS